jgi:hypothetical protein
MPRQLIFILFLLCGASFTQAQLHYRAQQLPNFPGIPFTVGLELNDRGEVQLFIEQSDKGTSG